MGCGSSIPVAEPDITTPESPPKPSDTVVSSSTSGTSSGTAAASTHHQATHQSRSSASSTSSTVPLHHPSATNTQSSSATTTHAQSSSGSGSSHHTTPAQQPQQQTSVWALSSTLQALSNIEDVPLRTASLQQFNDVWLTPDGNSLRKEFIAKEGADRIFAVIISTLQKGPQNTEGTLIVKLLHLLQQHSSVNHSSLAVLYFNDALFLEKTSLQTWVNLLIMFTSPSSGTGSATKDHHHPHYPSHQHGSSSPHSISPTLGNTVGNILLRTVPVEAVYSIADILIHFLTLTTLHTITMNNMSSNSSSSSSSTFVGPAAISTTEISATKRKQIKEYVTYNNEIWNWIISILRGLHSPNLKVLTIQLATALVDSDHSLTNTPNTSTSTAHHSSNSGAHTALSTNNNVSSGTDTEETLSPIANDDSGYEQCLNGMITLKGFEACTLLLSSCIGAGVTSQNAAVAYARKMSSNQNLENVVDSILGTASPDPSTDSEASTVIMLSPAPAILHLLHTCARFNKKEVFEAMAQANLFAPLHDLITTCIYPNLLRGSSVDLVLATVRLIQYIQQFKSLRPLLVSAGSPRICSQLLCTKVENETLKNRLTILQTSASQLLEQLFTDIMKTSLSSHSGNNPVHGSNNNNNEDTDENILTTYGYLLQPAHTHQPLPPPSFPPEAYELLPTLSLVPDTSLGTELPSFASLLEQIQDPFVYVTIIARTVEYPNGINVILSIGNIVEDKLTNLFLSNEKRLGSLRRRIAPLLWNIAIERARYTSKGWKEIRHTWHHIHRKQMEKLHTKEPEEEDTKEDKTEDTDSDGDSDSDTDPELTSDDNESVTEIEGSHTSDISHIQDSPSKKEGSPFPSDEHFHKYYTKGRIPYYVNERKTKAIWSKPRTVTATEVTTNTVTKIYSDSFIEPPKEDNRIGLRIFWTLYDAGYYRLMPNSVNSVTIDNEHKVVSSSNESSSSSFSTWWAEDDPVIRMCLCAIASEALCEAPFLHPTGLTSSTSELPVDHDSLAPTVRKENLTITSEVHTKTNSNDDDPFHINRHHHHWPYLHHKDNEKIIQDVLVYIRACVESLEAARRGQNMVPVLLRKSPSKSVLVNSNDKNRTTIPNSNGGVDNGLRSNFARTVSFSMDTPTRKGSTSGNGGTTSGNQSPRYRRSFLDGTNAPHGPGTSSSSVPGTPNSESMDWLNSLPGNASSSSSSSNTEWPFTNSGLTIGSLPYVLPFAFTPDFIASIARISRCQKYPETTTFAAFVIRDIYAAFVLKALEMRSTANEYTGTIDAPASKSNSRRTTFSSGHDASTTDVSLPGSNNQVSADYDENTFFGGIHLYPLTSPSSHRHPTMSPILAAVAGLPNMNNRAINNPHNHSNPNNAFVPRPNGVNPSYNNIPAPPGLGIEENKGIVIFHSPFQRQRAGSSNNTNTTNGNPTPSKVHQWTSYTTATTDTSYTNSNMNTNVPRCLINTVTVEDIDTITNNFQRLYRAHGASENNASATGILGSAMSHIRSLLSSSSSSSSSSTTTHSTVPVPSAVTLSSSLFTLPILQLRTGSLWQYPWILEQHNALVQDNSSNGTDTPIDDLKTMLIHCGAQIGIKSAYFQLTLNAKMDRSSPSSIDTDGSLSPIQQAKARLRKTNAYSNRYGVGNGNTGGSSSNLLERTRTNSISERSTISSPPRSSSEGIGSPDRSIPPSPSLYSTPTKGISNEAFTLTSPTAPVSNNTSATKPTFAFSPRGYTIPSPGILKNRKTTNESKEWELGLRLINEALTLLQGQSLGSSYDNSNPNTTTTDTGLSRTADPVRNTNEGNPSLGASGSIGTTAKGTESSNSLSKVVDALADHAAADDAFRRMKERSASARLERMRSKYLAAAAGNVTPLTSPDNNNNNSDSSNNNNPDSPAMVFPSPSSSSVASPSLTTGTPNRTRGIAHLRSFVLGTHSVALTSVKADSDTTSSAKEASTE